MKCCRHCQHKVANRPRGLCWSCFSDLDIRVLYPRNPMSGKLAVRDSYKTRPLPENPTDALPGSKEKLLVMEERASRQEQLFHPDDPYLLTQKEIDPICKVHLGSSKRPSSKFAFTNLRQ